jgi:hypothetical protein
MTRRLGNDNEAWERGRGIMELFTYAGLATDPVASIYRARLSRRSRGSSCRDRSTHDCVPDLPMDRRQPKQIAPVVPRSDHMRGIYFIVFTLELGPDAVAWTGLLLSSLGHFPEVPLTATYVDSRR